MALRRPVLYNGMMRYDASCGHEHQDVHHGINSPLCYACTGWCEGHDLAHKDTPWVAGCPAPCAPHTPRAVTMAGLPCHGPRIQSVTVL